MFFFLALFVASFILSAFITPKMKVENAKAASLNEFSFPRSKEGDPVPRFYGTCKLLSPNTISISGYRADPIKKKVKTGLFSSKKIITGYKYYLTVDLAWGLGPDVVYRRMWFGNNLVWAGCLYGEGCVNEIAINLPQLYGGSEDGKRGGIGGTIAMYCGSFTQPRDTYLVSNLSADVPAYVGVAHMVFRDFWWGNNASIDAVAVEAVYFTNKLGLEGSFYYMSNGLDANPIAVLYDILVDDWGNLGYDPAKINVTQWREAAADIWSEQNGISITVGNAQEAKDAIKTILRQINAIIFEDLSTGLVEIKLLRNDYDIDLLPVVDQSDIVDIKNYTKKLWSETNNIVRAKYEDREADYANDKMAIAKDSSLLRYQGKQRPVEIELPGVKVAALANAIAARELSNLNVPLYSCELITKRTVTSLRPGDVFKLAWPEYGIEQMVMRVRKMNLGSLDSGQITISVVQDEFAIDATVVAAPVASGYTPTTLTPVDISIFTIFELPAFLDYKAGLGTRVGSTRLASFVLAPTAYTLGYDAFIEDGAVDATVLSLAPYGANAKLSATMERFDGWLDGVIPAVTIKELTDTALLPVEGGIRDGGGLVMIGSELLAYEGYVDNLDGTYDLTNVHRAFIDTGWFKHLADSLIWFFDGQEGFFESDTPIASTVDVYFLDRTATGTSLEADATVTPVTTVGRGTLPVAPDYVTADADRTAWQEFNEGDVVSIDARARSRLDLVELWLEDDVAGTAEAGTTYRISVEVSGVVTVVADEVTLPYNLTTTYDMGGACIVLVEAKRDGLYSFAAAPMPIVVNTDSLTVDYELVTIDGERVDIP